MQFKYHNAHGEHVYTLDHENGKDKKVAIIENGHWDTLEATRQDYPYNLHLFKFSDKIIVAPTEPMADKLCNLGLVGTHLHCGRYKITKELTQYFENKIVYVLVENNEKEQSLAFLGAIDLVARRVYGLQPQYVGMISVGELVTQANAGNLEYLFSKAKPFNPAKAGEIVTAQDEMARIGQVKWLWPGWIPRGTVTIIAGDPGAGKTTFVSELVVRMAEEGQTWPNGEPIEGQGKKFLYFDTESGKLNFYKTLRKSERAMQAVRIPLANETLRLGNPDHLKALRSILMGESIDAVIIDSLRGACAGDENSSEFTEDLHTLARMSETTGTIFLIVHHFRKKAKEDKRHPLNPELLRGSSGIIAIARSIIGVADLGDRKTLIGLMKSNYSDIYGKRVGMVITDTGAEFIDAPIVRESMSKISVAKEQLVVMLSHGKREQGEVMEALTAQGISERTIKTAKKELGLVSWRENLPGSAGAGKWFWAFPAEDEKPNDFDFERSPIDQTAELELNGDFF
jgi:putative DNA primase/helicase